jgi:predicted transposase YbfD/YdcC
MRQLSALEKSIREALEHARRPDTEDRVLPFPPRRHRDADPLASSLSGSALVTSEADASRTWSFETHYHISSAPLNIEPIVGGARRHWCVESTHWLLDVEFKDDLSRYRTGHGAKNMAIVRRFARGLVRANKAKGSVKTRRKTAGWSPDFLLAWISTEADSPSERKCPKNGASEGHDVSRIHLRGNPGLRSFNSNER